ncbi:GSCOCG00008951001-RA-CDS [Cotesia congregata]|nr:GSCOCG00008951001-RA-CDS [Cotesia congregata]
MNILNRLLIINILIISITAEGIDKIKKKLRIKIYTGNSTKSAKIVNCRMNRPDLIYQYIDNSKSSVLYVFGFTEKPADESVCTIVDAYLNRGTVNMLVLDWSKLSYEEYFSLIPKVRVIAKITAKTIDRLFELGLNLDTFHIVGHSMGAPLAGAIGEFSEYDLPRITGNNYHYFGNLIRLDPTGPGYNPPLTTHHLNKKNAKFVDILHTDIGFFGITKTDGTADFFANGGKRPQPGCPRLQSVQDTAGICDHRKSWRIYAESIINPKAFRALKCPSYSDYLAGNCKNNDAVYFGLFTPTNARGFYYFDTSKSLGLVNTVKAIL